jgi:hypothetical protein
MGEKDKREGEKNHIEQKAKTRGKREEKEQARLG